MSFNNLTIKGYKSIKELELQLKNINILLGINGAGKSNLISFFEMLQFMSIQQLQNYITEHGGSNSFLYNGIKNTKEIYFSISRAPYTFHARLKAATDNRLYFAQQNLYNYKEQSNLYAADGLEELKDNGLIKKTNIFNSIGIYHFHDTSESSPMKLYCGINDNIELAKDGRNLAAVLYRIKMKHEKAYKRIVSIIQLVAPYFQDFVLRNNPLNEDLIQIEWYKKGCDIPFTASQLSDGTLRFICLVVLLCLPESLAKDIIIIDEPELGLHPYAISLLSGLVKKAAVEKQIILATQSVELINEFSADDIIVVNNEDGTSVFSRLNTEDFKDWLEDYSLGELWTKNIIGGSPV
ncbi:AAA family ATPase [Lachnospiraceae bacterium NSJ-143]|mgnify:CR=1 FL=1|nr:AAA family ATPase [Lachnospiraceae bacterium NSJ-143]